MADMTSIAVGLQSIKTALEITKELRNIDSSLKDVEVKLKLAELIESLSDAKIQLSEAREENQELNNKIRNLEDELNRKDEVEFKDGYYYLKDRSKGKAPGPFCAKCYGDEGKLILVSELPKQLQHFGKFKCPKCNDVGG